MVEGGVVADTTYKELIEEVFIDPIRTVVVIDDQFPSLDSLIAMKLKSAGAWDGKDDDAIKVQSILDFCRQKDRPWLVDVHDGRKVDDINIAPYLQHSDLMILDYHLEEGDENGNKAINILRELAGNDHFNMVVVYTKGYEKTGEGIDKVVREIALGLTFPDSCFGLTGEEIDQVSSAIADWEVEDDKILSKFKEHISERLYLLCMRYGSKSATKTPEGESICELWKGRPEGVNLELQHLINWLLLNKQKEIADQLSKDYLGVVDLDIKEGVINWVRTDRLFITVIGKDHAPEEIPDKLVAAINEWCPMPHRLLMAKMRALMDEHGAVAEAEVLSNEYIQAGWLKEVLESSDENQKQVVKNTVNRHWESLGDVLLKDVDIFTDRLVTYLKSQSEDEILKTHCYVDLKAESINILKHINHYNNAKPIEGNHLTTGHVLELERTGEKEYWVCLSPACDLVPGQKESGWFGRLKDYMPFVAVSIKPVKVTTALAAANENIFLFLNVHNEIEAFTFYPDGNIKSNPSWEQLFARNQGKFIMNNPPEIEVGFVYGNDALELRLENTKARVVSQLRYEYALNLLQRLGVTLSRIGLDFQNMKKEEIKKDGKADA